jgi:hypothetical protein
MMDIVMAIAAPLARTYGINKAIEIAYEQLGITPPQTDPIDIYTGGGIAAALNPANLGNVFKRGAVNLGVRSLLGSVPMGPLALAGGAAFLGNKFNPLNPNARNYSPNLSGQIGYLSGREEMIGRNPNTGLMVYGPGSVLAGQNVMSIAGTNNYQKALDKKISYFENRIKKGKPISERNYERAKKEKKELFDYRADVRDAAKTKSGLGTFSRPNMKDVSGNGGGGTSTGSPTNVGNPLGYRYGGIVSL